MWANVLSVRKSRAGRDWQCPSFQSGEDFCINIPLRTKLLNVDTKIFPGFFKKNSHATRQASNVRSPLQPPLQGCNLKGVNIPNMNGCFFLKAHGDNPKETTLKLGGEGDPTIDSTVLLDGCFLWRTRTETKDIVSPCQHYFFVRSGHWLTLGQRMQNMWQQSELQIG